MTKSSHRALLYTLTHAIYPADEEQFRLLGLNPEDVDGPTYTFMNSAIHADLCCIDLKRPFKYDIDQLKQRIFDYEASYHDTRLYAYDGFSLKYRLEHYGSKDYRHPEVVLFEKVPKRHIIEYFELRNSGILDII